MPNIQSIPVTSIAGEQSSLAAFAGKVLLVVNVASECGFTPQYEQLETLQKTYAGRGFSVLGFPANDFGAQEPGTNAQIAQFCSTKFGVSFPLFEKIVATGPEKHPLYAALIEAAPRPETNGDDFRNGIESYAAKNDLPAPTKEPELLWNFEKFLVSREGKVVARFRTEVAPDDPRVIQAIEAELAK